MHITVHRCTLWKTLEYINSTTELKLNYSKIVWKNHNLNKLNLLLLLEVVFDSLYNIKYIIYPNEGLN